MSSKRLVIVQDRPTQFDVPLYAKISKERPFDLDVFYSAVERLNFDHDDPELGFAPTWDHLRGLEYSGHCCPLNSAADVRALARQIMQVRPDLVIVCGYLPIAHAQLARILRRAGCCVGLRSDTTLEHSNMSGLKGILKRIALPLVLRGYSSWHPVGSLAQIYLETMARTKRPVYPFPYAPDESWFAERVKRVDRYGVRHEMGVPEDAFVVLGIMKWTEREDPITLIRAFREFCQDHAKTRLLLVGDGPLRETVRRALAGVTDVVITPGYVPYSKLPELYAISDLFVHPARSEPWGVSIQEALASGIPVVASSAVGALRDLMPEGGKAVQFPIADTGALVRLLNKAVETNFHESQLVRQPGFDYGSTISNFSAAMEGSEFSA